MILTTAGPGVYIGAGFRASHAGQGPSVACHVAELAGYRPAGVAERGPVGGISLGVELGSLLGSLLGECLSSSLRAGAVMQRTGQTIDPPRWCGDFPCLIGHYTPVPRETKRTLVTIWADETGCRA